MNIRNKFETISYLWSSFEGNNSVQLDEKLSQFKNDCESCVSKENKGIYDASDIFIKLKNGVDILSHKWLGGVYLIIKMENAVYSKLINKSFYLVQAMFSDDEIKKSKLAPISNEYSMVPFEKTQFIIDKGKFISEDEFNKIFENIPHSVKTVLNMRETNSIKISCKNNGGIAVNLSKEHDSQDKSGLKLKI